MWLTSAICRAADIAPRIAAAGHQSARVCGGRSASARHGWPEHRRHVEVLRTGTEDFDCSAPTAATSAKCCIALTVMRRRLCAVCQVAEPLEALRASLQCSHIAPTAPNTLAAIPSAEKDPFLIEECPHVYFAGCQRGCATSRGHHPSSSSHLGTIPPALPIFPSLQLFPSVRSDPELASSCTATPRRRSC